MMVVIRACIILHNLAIQHNDEYEEDVYGPLEEEDSESDQSFRAVVDDGGDWADGCLFGEAQRVQRILNQYCAANYCLVDGCIRKL